MTPIMWDIAIIPARLQWIFRINPIYYIVNGYREAILVGRGFWHNGLWTLYFWAVTIIMFALGSGVFSRLTIHFADVL